MGAPFKMKGFSGFGNSPAKKIGLPKKGYGLPKEYSLRARKEGFPGFNDKDWARFEKGHKAANKAEWAKVGRVASRVLGAAGVAATMYDMYKSGQKHSGGKIDPKQKSIISEGKKKTKSIWRKN